MLRKFRVSGIYSFGAELQEVEFLARPRSRIGTTKYEFNFASDQKDRPMKSAVFFGANASGKTNLFTSIKILLNIIKSGLANTRESRPMRHAFNQKAEAITLGVEVSNDEKVFSYDITFDKDRIFKESFFVDGKKIFVYKDGEVGFANSVENSKVLRDFFSKQLSENILHILKDDNISYVQEFLDCIRSISIYGTRSFPKYEARLFSREDRDYFDRNKQLMLDIFRLLDDSIENFDFVEIRPDEEQSHVMRFERRGEIFHYVAESDGIKKIVQLAKSINKVVRGNKVLLVDELDSSISTLALIKIFNDLINTPENKSGQLIVTSHNVLLFDVTFLNSQQIFLVEKNEDLESRVKTYYEYDIRSEKKRAYIDYLKGRYDG